MNELVSGAESTGNGAAVSVLMRVALLVSSVSVVAVSAVVDSGAVYELIVSFASRAVVVTALGCGIAKVVILAFRVLNAVIMAFRAAIFASRLNMFLRRFFFWECFPCPGPGILNVIDNKKKLRRLVNWCWVLCG